MKKTLAIIMTVVMLFGMLVPVSAATSPVKDVATAKAGELLYTFNFKGDDAFKPDVCTNSNGQMEYVISADGSAVTIKGINGGTGTDKVGNYWGGVVEAIPATPDSIYTMVYEVKANGTAGKNNSVGVGGWVLEDGINASKVYNNYSNHNTVDANGDKSTQRSSLSYASGKLTAVDDRKGADSYVYTSALDYDTNADGFITVAVVYNGIEGSFTCYYLAKGAKDITQESSWIIIEENIMANAGITDGAKEYMGFWTYAYYQVVDTTIRNARIYKDAVWAKEAATTPAPTTEAPTQAPTTEAPTTVPATDAPTAAPTDKATDAATEPAAGGCGSTVTVAGLAIVAALGTCAVFVEKKRK